MKITLLCNAGLSLEYCGETLLVDLPNTNLAPYYPLPDDTWKRILNREAPYENIAGMYFTHEHPDHCDKNKRTEFEDRWPDVPVFVPSFSSQAGTFSMGKFRISYSLVEHAPLPWSLPPHVVTWIEAGDESLYIAADAALDPTAHYDFLNGRQADVGIWNAMYLSRPETRQLIRNGAKKNYIYHMPADQTNDGGMWKKCRSNMQRYREELKNVTIMDSYPYNI